MENMDLLPQTAPSLSFSRARLTRPIDIFTETCSETTATSNGNLNFNNCTEANEDYHLPCLYKRK